jgi:translation initiation factor IF-3
MPPSRPQRGGRQQDTTRINGLITTDPIRLIDQDGNQVGVVPLREALRRAEMAELDLVEISPNAEPPVCKILDYGKYRFQMQKKAAEARKNQVTVTVKEITMRPRTEEHDYQVKLKKMREFLTKGDKLKVTIRFRGRELAHQEMGMEMMTRIEADLTDIGKVDQRPRLEGRHMGMMLSPLAPKK